MEVWKDIQDYEGYYQVSNLGRVKSLDRYIYNYRGGKALRKGIILKLGDNGKGYLILDLMKEGKRQSVKVHRLVAKAFIPNPNNKPQTNHIDGIKTNNYYMNLEWCTQSENTIHSYKNGLQKIRLGSEHHMSKLIESEVLEIRKLCVEGDLSRREIGKLYGVTKSCVMSINKRRIWKHI